MPAYETFSDACPGSWQTISGARSGNVHDTRHSRVVPGGRLSGQVGHAERDARNWLGWPTFDYRLRIEASNQVQIARPITWFWTCRHQGIAGGSVPERCGTARGREHGGRFSSCEWYRSTTRLGALGGGNPAFRSRFAKSLGTQSRLRRLARLHGNFILTRSFRRHSNFVGSMASPNVLWSLPGRARRRACKLGPGRARRFFPQNKTSQTLQSWDESLEQVPPPRNCPATE